MSIYDLIPSSADLMAKNVSRENELQAALVKDVAQFLNSSKQFFQRGLDATFYPERHRDNGEYEKYWLNNRQLIADNLNGKGFVTVIKEGSTGLFISLPRIEEPSNTEKVRTPITTVK